MIAVNESVRRASAYHEAGHVVAACCIGLDIGSVSISETRFVGHVPDLGWALVAAAGPMGVMLGGVGNTSAGLLSPVDRRYIDAAGVGFGEMAVEARRLLRSQAAALRSFAATLANSRTGIIDAEEVRRSWWTNHDLDALTTWRAAHSAYCTATAWGEAVKVGLNVRRIDAATRRGRGRGRGAA